MKTSLISLALLGLLSAGSAYADFTLNRETTLSDEFGGQIHSVTQGTLAPEGGERDTVVTFSNFHPNTESSTVNGEIEGHFQRVDEEATRTYNGNLSIVAAPSGGDPRTLTLGFENLAVIRSDDGASLSGTLVVNGRSIDAAEAPAAVRSILLRLIRFLRY